MECYFERCKNKVHAKNYCEVHYRRWKKGKILTPIKPKVFYDKICSFDGCKGKRTSKTGFGLCSWHYRQKRTGQTLKPIKHKIFKYNDNELCKFKLCNNKPKAGGFCSGHYQQVYHNLTLKPLVKKAFPNKNKCQVTHCDNKYRSAGFCKRHYEIWYTFKLDPNVYERMFKQQDNVCAICKQVCKSKRRLSVDHDHKTGKIRGLLCAKCNRAIGLLEDSPELLIKAAEYLKNFLSGI